MGESRRVVGGEDVLGCAAHSVKKSRYTQPRLSKLKFSTCVDSIKENFRRISTYHGNSRNAASNRDKCVAERKEHCSHSSVTLKGPVEQKQKRKRTSIKAAKGRSTFETYLSTIPKLDPIDRTVCWVLSQPDEVARSELYDDRTKYFEKNDEEVDYDTSVSRCESERGTHGRGTPPTREVGQPRLDDLFRKIQMKQEKEARRLKIHSEFALRDNHPTNSWNMRNPLQENVPYTRKLPPDIVHKNSFYYNQTTPYMDVTDNFRLKTVTEHCCEWRTCTAKFLSNKDLLKHVQEDHIAPLPLHVTSDFQSQRQLICQWRNCKENKCYPARYKLLLHLQRFHCNGRRDDKVEEQSFQIMTGTLNLGHARSKPTQQEPQGSDSDGVTDVDVTEQLSVE